MRTPFLAFGIVSSAGLWWDVCLMGDICFAGRWFLFFIKNNFENLPIQRTKWFSSPDENTPGFIFSSSGLYSTSAPFLPLSSISGFICCTQWSASSCGLLRGSCLDSFSACRHQRVVHVPLFQNCSSTSIARDSFILPSLSFSKPLHFVRRELHVNLFVPIRVVCNAVDASSSWCWVSALK